MGTEKSKGRCLILGSGEILDYGAVAARLRGDEFVLCADGGFLHCGKLGIKPHLIVGDFDSIGRLPENVERICYPAEKNYTDSTLAIKTAAERGYTRLLMVGMLGGRFDHSLANMQNLAWCAKNGIKAQITDGRTDILTVKDGEIILPQRENSYFSVFPLITKCRGVTIEGAKYPLDSYDLVCDSPRAVSNEFAGRDVKITVKRGTIAVVITAKDNTGGI